MRCLHVIYCNLQVIQNHKSDNETFECKFILISYNELGGLLPRNVGRIE